MVVDDILGFNGFVFLFDEYIFYIVEFCGLFNCKIFVYDVFSDGWIIISKCVFIDVGFGILDGFCVDF